MINSTALQTYLNDVSVNLSVSFIYFNNKYMNYTMFIMVE